MQHGRTDGRRSRYRAATNAIPRQTVRAAAKTAGRGKINVHDNSAHARDASAKEATMPLTCRGAFLAKAASCQSTTAESMPLLVDLREAISRS